MHLGTREILVAEVNRTEIMATPITNQGLGQERAANDVRLAAAQSDPDSDVDPVLLETPPPRTTPDSEIETLRAERATLRCTVEELEKLLEDKMRAEQAWIEKQKELEALVEEKSEVIRELHLKLQERSGGSVPREPSIPREPGITPQPSIPREPGITPREEELLALSEELEEERRQLREDEESVTKQMREMEVQMSRERAELARQRNDLQRLHGEIRHELELAARHAALRDRLEPLQRRHQEMILRKGAEPSRASAPAAAPQDQAGAPPQEASTRNSTGLLHRLFG